jgi:gas vesicle protein
MKFYPKVVMPVLLTVFLGLSHAAWAKSNKEQGKEIGAKVDDAKDKVKEKAHDAKEKGKEVVDKVKEKATDAKDKVKEKIHEATE